MTRPEFATVMAYIGLGLNKPLANDALEVYFDLLCDIPLPILKLAAKRVLVEHRWATFPTIAEIRAAAAESARGEVSELSPAEAWQLAWKAAGRIDLEVEGSLQRACEGLPRIVIESMESFGIPALCNGQEPVGVVRGQFLKIFEQLQARERRAALLPLATQNELRGIRESNQSQRILSIAGQIGKMEETA